MADSTHPSVELVWEEDCPHVEAARAVLQRALQNANLPAEWEEWDVNAPETPESRRAYGSPTILVDGRDVVGADPAGATSCRVYQHDDGSYGGVPEVETVTKALLANR